jgi:AcrR family transcriptional regulator
MAYRQTERTKARAADVRQRILAAAHAQLNEGGYASATVSTVAKRAGVATGSVYRHFPSKGDLFAEAFRIASQREVDAVAGADDLADAVEIFVRRALAAPVRAYALIAEPVDPAVDAERLRFRRAYADLFVEKVGGDEVVAAAIVGALGEAILGPLANHDRDPDDLVRTLQAFCLNATGAINV